MSYFFSTKLALKADIIRHCEKEKELRNLIAEAEQDTSEFGPRRLKAYNHFLQQLLKSKAQITSKIGKK